MSAAAPQLVTSQHQPSVESQQKRRSRRYPLPGKARWLAFIRFSSVLTLLAFTGFFIHLALTRLHSSAYLSLGLLALFAFLRVYAFAESRNLRCTLCHNPVLVSKHCRKHRSARKIPLFGYLPVVVFSMLFQGKFQCMYCGTDFRLKK